MQERKLLLKNWKILVLSLTFIAPIFFAVGVYLYKDLFQFNLKVHGELLSNPIKIENLDLFNKKNSFQGQWQLVYFSPKDCRENCKNKMQLLRNLHTVLGKDKSRVHVQFIEYEIKKSFPISANYAQESFVADSILIIDPNGWIIMHYSPLKFEAKKILQDIRRLLRYSHVG